MRLLLLLLVATLVQIALPSVRLWAPLAACRPLLLVTVAAARTLSPVGTAWVSLGVGLLIDLLTDRPIGLGGIGGALAGAVVILADGTLEKSGVKVLKGEAERLLPLSHDRAFCLNEGIGSADVVLVPLEDGDRCHALMELGKTVIAIDLNPLSRTAMSASLTIVDEVTRALPVVAQFCRELTKEEPQIISTGYDNRELLRAAIQEILSRLNHALD